jgi:hypothetical protein
MTCGEIQGLPLLESRDLAQEVTLEICLCSQRDQVIPSRKPERLCTATLALVGMWATSAISGAYH